MIDLAYCPNCDKQWIRTSSKTICPYCDVLLSNERVSRTANGGSLERAGSGAPVCDVELALALSRYVHDNCTNVPHDIGIHLAHIVDEYLERRPVLPNDQAQRPDTTL